MNRSEAAKLRWQDPAYREKMYARNHSPEYIQARKQQMLERWANASPEEFERMHELGKSRKGRGTCTIESVLERTERKDSGCLEWTGSRVLDGYGQVSFEKKYWRTHRLFWTLFVGPIPKGLQVLHRCDNPPCVEITHLFLGTHADNMADKIQKGRTSKPVWSEESRKAQGDRTIAWRAKKKAEIAEKLEEELNSR